MKELNNVNLNEVISSRLPQFKSYLKILGILYFIENTNLFITVDMLGMVHTRGESLQDWLRDM